MGDLYKRKRNFIKHNRSLKKKILLKKIAGEYFSKLKECGSILM